MKDTPPALAIEQVQLAAEATRMATGANGYSPAPGLCAQAMRLVTTRVLGAPRSWHSGPDALQVGDILRARGVELPPGSFPQLGDLILFTGPEHGPHGHLGMRVLGNRMANNSTWNWNRTGDARGFRPLSILTGHERIFRLWRP